MKTAKIILFGLSLMLFASTCMGQEDWDAYQPRTLKEIIELHKHLITDNRLTFLFTADHFPSLVKVVYTGKMRPLNPDNAVVISEWAKVREVDKNIVGLFEKEILFTENSVEYWLPVQSQLIPYFEKELKAGDSVELYLMWIGAKRDGDKTHWTFLVNEFDHSPNPAKVPLPLRKGLF